MFTCTTKHLSEACPSTCICEKHLTTGRINQVADGNMRSTCNAGPISSWNSPISQFTPTVDFPVRRCTFWLAERNNRTDIVIGQEERIRSVTHQHPCCWNLLSSTMILIFYTSFHTVPRHYVALDHPCVELKQISIITKDCLTLHLG